MARIRTIKPEFWDDEKIGDISRDARLLFIASWNNADDEGLVRWSPEHLKSVAFRYDDDIDALRVREIMAELTSCSLVFAYQAGTSRQRIGYIINFRKHQRINRANPGKLTPPSLANPQVALMYVERDGYMCHLCGEPIPRKRQVDLDPYDPTAPPSTQCLNPSLDHLAPRSKGGSDYPSNIGIAHVGCNKSRRDKSADDFNQPTSVGEALDWLKGNKPELLIGSVSDSVPDSVSDSLSDSLIEVELPVVNGPKRSTQRNGSSVSRSLRDSQDQHLPEGKGREGSTTPNGVGAAAPTVDEVTPRAVVGAWVEAMTKNDVTPTQGMRNQVGKLAKELLAHNDPQRVMDAARQCGAKGFATIDRELAAMNGRAVANVRQMPQRSPSSPRDEWMDRA